MVRESIDKAGVRNRLQPRREPYWGPPVERGLYVGFRRLDMGGNWVARYRADDGRQVYKALGPVTDENDYDAAKTEARRWRKTVDAGVKSGEVETVADACADYVTALRKSKREAAARDAQLRFARTIDADPLGRIKLAQLRERHLEASAWKPVSSRPFRRSEAGRPRLSRYRLRHSSERLLR